MTRCLLAGILVLFLPLAGQAQNDDPRPEGPTDPVELEAFLDGLMAAYLQERDLPGATLSVVQGGRIALVKGYGLADVQANRNVSGEDSLFRIGSISKLLVWTAVMQLVEEGRLDLDTDVNTYLNNLVVPATYKEPITLTHLLTHTPGFEDRVIGLFARSEDRLRPLEELLIDELPLRVRPPGQVAAYSNHGTALAALVVQDVSGMPWEDWVEQRILTPLGMSRTTVRQPLPAQFEDDMAKGYQGEKGAFVEKGFEFVPCAPAGSTSASAGDMARFMLAHLQLGELDGQRILREETAKRMQSVLFRHADGLSGTAHGFYEMSRNGQRIIGHGGNTRLFHSQLALFPEIGLGLFVSTNGPGGAALTDRLLTAFCERFFPYEAEKPEAAENTGPLSRYLGHYRGNRYSHTSIARLSAIQTVEVSASDDGGLKTMGSTYLPVGEHMFVSEDGKDRIAFREENGAVTHMFLGDMPVIAFERAATLEAMPTQSTLAIVAVAVFLATVLLPPLFWILRKKYGAKLDPERRLPALPRYLGWFTALTFILFLLGATISLREPDEIVFGMPELLDQALWVALAGFGLTALLALALLVVWIRRSGPLLARLRFTVVTLTCVAFVWQLHLWNLLQLERAEILWNSIHR